MGHECSDADSNGQGGGQGSGSGGLGKGGWLAQSMHFQTGMRSDPIRVPVTQRQATRERWDAIVVGTGVGGCVTAALLARRGLRVLVLEKNRRLGGILASYEKQGFKLDWGSHLISRGSRGPLAKALHLAGLNRPRLLTHPIPVRSRGIFQIAAPAHRSGLLRTALAAARVLGLTARERLNVARLFFWIFTLTPWELARWDRRTLDELIRCHTEHPATYFLMSFLASIFFVLPPWEVSAGESIRCLRTILKDYRLSYVEGGMDSIPHALLNRVVEAGGQILVGQRATSIERTPDGLRVTTQEGSTYVAPACACNMAPIDLLPLLDVSQLPADWVTRVESIRGSGSAHQVRLALSRPLVDEGCLIGGVSLSGLTLADLSIDLMRHTVDDIAVGRVSDPLAVYASVPSNYDPTLAPPGCQSIIASIYGPVAREVSDPPEVWREAALKALASIIPGLEDALIFAEFTPIPKIAAWMGKSSQGAISNGQYPGQVGRDRLPTATPIAGLYLCGDGAGGRGIGTELAATSAFDVVDQILRRARSELAWQAPGPVASEERRDWMAADSAEAAHG